MAIRELETKWTAIVKQVTQDAKKANPPKAYDAVLTEAQSVAGALDKCIAFWEKVEKPLEDGLLKKLTAAISHAENTTREIVNFIKAAKAVDYAYLGATELDKDLDEVIKAGRLFKEAIKKFEKNTD